MATARRPVLGPSGHPAIRAGGRPLVFDASGECAECCGGGGGGGPGVTCCNLAGVNCGFQAAGHAVRLTWSLTATESAEYVEYVGGGVWHRYVPTTVTSSGSMLVAATPALCGMGLNHQTGEFSIDGITWRARASVGVRLGVFNALYVLDTTPFPYNGQITNLDRPSRNVQNAATMGGTVGIDLIRSQPHGGDGSAGNPFINANGEAIVGARTGFYYEARVGVWEIQCDTPGASIGRSIPAKSGSISGPVNSCPTAFTANASYRILHQPTVGPVRYDCQVNVSLAAEFLGIAPCASGLAASDCGCGCGGNCH